MSHNFLFTFYLSANYHTNIMKIIHKLLYVVVVSTVLVGSTNADENVSEMKQDSVDSMLV